MCSFWTYLTWIYVEVCAFLKNLSLSLSTHCLSILPMTICLMLGKSIGWEESTGSTDSKRASWETCELLLLLLLFIYLFIFTYIYLRGESVMLLALHLHLHPWYLVDATWVRLLSNFLIEKWYVNSLCCGLTLWLIRYKWWFEWVGERTKCTVVSFPTFGRMSCKNEFMYHFSPLNSVFLFFCFYFIGYDKINLELGVGRPNVLLSTIHYISAIFPPKLFFWWGRGYMALSSLLCLRFYIYWCRGSFMFAFMTIFFFFEKKISCLKFIFHLISEARWNTGFWN